MAIVQISKIQQRSGNLVDLPQLDNAEFGWASDQQRLFIGRTGSTVSDENVEVLTSYSDISFSQIVGSDGGNFNIDAATNGQVLTYIASTNTWENYPSAAVLANASFKLNLGNANSLSISGGSIGYVLETDGYGNLSWTSKGTLRANISGLSNATPIIMTVANTIAYQNGTSITISGVNGVANSNVNSRTFYVKLASNFPTSGNVELYTSPDLVIGNAAIGTSLTYTNSPNAIATTALGGSGSAVAAGSNNQVQFNNSGLFGASANLTFDGNTMVVTGIANVSSNVNVSGNINLTRQLISTQATGTAPFSVVSTTRVSNLNVTYANVADHINTALVTTGTYYPVLANATSGNVADGANANLSFNAATGNLSTTLLSVTSNANVGNLGTAGLVVATGNVTGGNLTTGGVLSVTGNANVGNLGTAGLVVATGNVTGGNLTTGGVLSVTGNANVGNLGTAGLITATGNVTGGNLVTGGLIVATGNVTGGNLTTGGVLSVTGNANVGNLGTTTAIITTGNITTINSGLLQNGNSNITITANGNVAITAAGGTTELVITSTGANITGTANISGNANVGNLGTATAIITTGNITTINSGLMQNGNSNITITANGNVAITAAGGTTELVITSTGANIAGTLNATGNANVGNLGTNIILADTIIGDGVSGNLDIYGRTGIAGDYNTGGIIDIAGGNGNASGYTVGGYVQLRGGNGLGIGGTAELAGGSADGTGARVLARGGTSQGVGLGEGYGGNLEINGGNSVGTDLPGGITFISGGKGTGAGTPGNVVIQVSTALTTGTTTQTLSNVVVVTSTSANVTGTLNATGNVTGGNITTAGRLVSSVATGTAPLVVTSTTVVPNLYVARANVADFINANLATTGTFYPVLGSATSGNITESANANLSFNAANGALSATTFVGALSGAATSATTAGTVTTNAQPNITSVSTSFTSLTFANAQTISGNNMTLTTGANTNAGTITGNWSLSTGSRLQATYADLAEYYQADAYYDPGTVLEFGGEKEVTIAEDGTTRVAGVVSTDPAYAMNAKCPGIAVALALQGRVPTKVRGSVRKGDMMVSAGNGYARPWNNPQMGTVIGKALENFDGIEGIIEVAVGRL